MAERPIALPPERLEDDMLSDPGKGLQARTRFVISARALTNERGRSSAAAAYDAEGENLISKTGKIIAASKRTLREAEAVLKRR